MILVKFFWATCSFAHLSLVTWANWSQSLICHERPERLAHSCSFDMSNLSDLLTVAHLSWAIWANRLQSLIWFERSEQLSELAMSEWANSQPCLFHLYYVHLYFLKYIFLFLASLTYFGFWLAIKDIKNLGLVCY